MVERRAHRHRVGVVAVVHEDDPVAELQALAAETGEAYARSAVGHLRGRGAEGDAGGDRGQGVGQVVGLGEGEVEALLAGRGGDQRLGDAVGDARLGARRRRRRVRSGAGSAPGRGAAPARRPRPGPPPMPSGGSASRTSALAAAIAATEPSSSTWTGPTLVITATSGSAIAASSAIWPAPAHRHLQDQGLGVVGGFEHGQRQPDLGVEVLDVGVDPAGQQRPGDVLDRGLADRAGDARAPRRRARGARRGPAPAAPQRVLGRRRPRPASRSALAASRRRAEAARGELGPRRRPRRRPRAPPAANSPPSRLAAAQAEEEIAGTAGAGVDRRPPRRPARRPRRGPRPRARRRSPPAGRASRRAPQPPQLLAGDLAVVEGDLAAALEFLALLVALAGDDDGVAGLGPAERQRDRGAAVDLDLDLARSPSSAPAATSATIASGSSERGLSEVTTARSESSAPARPIFGRLSRSRSPPAPKTEISRPVGQPPRRPQHVLHRVRGVRVVDQDGEALALVDRLEAPRRPAPPRARPAAARRRRRPPSPPPRRSAPSALATLKCPGSRVRTATPADARTRRRRRRSSTSRAE